MADQNSLRHAAMLARQRMKSGYWTRGRGAEHPAKSECAAAEDGFLEKVRYIMEHEGEVQNPIRMLVDEDRFQKADFAGKQKLILETSAKYQRVREELARRESR